MRLYQSTYQYKDMLPENYDKIVLNIAKVIDSANKWNTLLYKEALHITRFNPSLDDAWS